MRGHDCERAEPRVKRAPDARRGGSVLYGSGVCRGCCAQAAWAAAAAAVHRGGSRRRGLTAVSSLRTPPAALERTSHASSADVSARRTCCSRLEASMAAVARRPRPSQSHRFRGCQHSDLQRRWRRRPRRWHRPAANHRAGAQAYAASRRGHAPARIRSSACLALCRHSCPLVG